MLWCCEIVVFSNMKTMATGALADADVRRRSRPWATSRHGFSKLIWVQVQTLPGENCDINI